MQCDTRPNRAFMAGDVDGRSDRDRRSTRETVDVAQVFWDHGFLFMYYRTGIELGMTLNIRK